MNTNKNSYTFIYASIVVIIVAFLLAFVSSALHSRQQKNIDLDKMKQVLASLNVRNVKDAEAAYKQYIVSEQLLSADGSVATSTQPYQMGEKGGDKGCAFLCTTADILDKRPVFVASVDGQTKYVFPLYGNGLWGPIWGYVSLNADRQTVYGVYFSHASETPGLGAEITNYEKFQVPFGGKHVMKDGSVALSVVKNGNVKDAEFEVNGLSGATFTSKGVSDMLQKDLSAYAAFLGAESNQ
ncbi:MAG: NADH:ubiquinone reductase (Na(+)-transporting) subunit C [Bacteroidaceae bacterium]|nr:NADH:ubiquinone reductase (Na(+)-transporting) subunit C [Bacteroidaceae bacterium]